MLLAVLIVHATLAASLNPIRASSEDAFFHDDVGRVRIFHGLNGVAKQAPWWPSWLLNESLVQEIASLGVNVMRLGWMYNGFEPSQGKFNDTYFQQFSKVVDVLASYGIYTLLDVHQDCLSSKFCLYDSFPLWALNKSEPSPHPFPWPYTKNCTSRQWGSNCLTEAASLTYQNLYHNYGGMRDDFSVFWKETAARWKGNPNILGYEIINEPFAGAIYEDPLLFLPGVAGAKNLQPFYDALSLAIRSSDNEHIIFYEPVTWGMVLNGTWTGSGFTHVPGGELYKNTSCLSYHYYCESFGDIPRLCDSLIAPSVFRSIAEEVAHTGGAAMLTEWGECDDQSSMTECIQVMDEADKFLQSWTEWGSYGQSQRSPPPLFKASISRTFAQAIAGNPVNMSYSDNDHSFALCYNITLRTTQPTVVFAAFDLHYPRGVTVKSTPNIEVQSSPASNQILLSALPTTKEGELVCAYVSAN